MTRPRRSPAGRRGDVPSTTPANPRFPPHLFSLFLRLRPQESEARPRREFLPSPPQEAKPRETDFFNGLLCLNLVNQRFEHEGFVHN